MTPISGATTYQITKPEWMKLRDTLKIEFFSERLRVAMAASATTQKELSSDLGLSPWSTHHWLNGRAWPKYETLIRIPEELGMPLDVLLKQTPIDLTKV